MSNQETPSRSDTKHAPDPMNLEDHQPDPMLQMSTGKLGPGGITLVGCVIALIVAVVLYGLNGPTAESASQSAAPTTSTAASSTASHG